VAPLPRVLHLVGSFHQGGSERQAIQLVSGLLRSGRFQPLVACLDGSGVLAREVERLGLGEVPAYPLTSFYNANAVKQTFVFSRMLRRERIAIVHAHDFYTNVFGLAGAALAGVCVRIGAKRETGGVRTPAQERAELLAYRLASAVVANSQSVADWLIKKGVSPKKIAVIHNGVDLSRVTVSSDRSRTELRAEFGLPTDPPAVLMVANLRLPVKDHPTFLRAAGRVHEQIPNAIFLLAGEGELADQMRGLVADLGIGSVTHFLGRCQNLAELIAAADVCVLSSKSEGFPNAVLEYMGGGRPVVATDVGGTREAVIDGETGFLVPAGDDAAMAARIAALLSSPEVARAMGTTGRQVVEERFSCDAQLAAVEALYDRLLRQTGWHAAR
jgi:glycosyltransferase involved in cell wall biosynthesis